MQKKQSWYVQVYCILNLVVLHSKLGCFSNSKQNLELWLTFWDVCVEFKCVKRISKTGAVFLINKNRGQFINKNWYAENNKVFQWCLTMFRIVQYINLDRCLYHYQNSWLQMTICLEVIYTLQAMFLLRDHTYAWIV